MKPIINNIDTNTLIKIIKEFEEMHITGILPEGEARKHARDLNEEYRVPIGDAIKIVENEAIWLAAMLWVNAQQKIKV